MDAQHHKSGITSHVHVAVYRRHARQHKPSTTPSVNVAVQTHKKLTNVLHQNGGILILANANVVQECLIKVAALKTGMIPHANADVQKEARKDAQQLNTTMTITASANV